MTSTQGLRLKYSIGSNFHDEVQARVLDLQHHDVILGMTWFKDLKIRFDVGMHRLYATRKGVQFTLKCVQRESLQTDPCVAQADLCTAEEVLNRLSRSQPFPMMLAHLSPLTPDESTSPIIYQGLPSAQQRALKRLLDDFPRVFRDELPDYMPANRG